MEEQRKSFLDIGKGAMLERFDYELEKVIDNILDPNTPASKPRKITLTLTLKPDAERLPIGHEVVIKSNLQPTNAILGSTAIVPDNNGVISLVEMVPQIPGQLSVDGNTQTEPDVIQFPKRA